MPKYTLGIHYRHMQVHSRTTAGYRRYLEGGDATYSFSSSLPFYFSKQRTFFAGSIKELDWAGLEQGKWANGYRTRR